MIQKPCLWVLVTFFIFLIMVTFFSLTKIRNDSSKLLKVNLTISLQQLPLPEKLLIEKLSAIKRSCGDVCDCTIKGKPGEYFDKYEKKIDCEEILSNENFDAKSDFINPPAEIPYYLLYEFTLGDKMKVLYDFHDNGPRNETTAVLWSQELIESQITLLEMGELEGPHGKMVVDKIMNHIDNYLEVKEKDILIIGNSESPWLESILLYKGASKVSTFSMAKLESQHQRIEILSLELFAQKYFDGVQFDAMISYSVFQELGLGRYGELLNPWGDQIAMAKAWCLVKPGGRALVGLPTGPDTIIFNTGRMYGNYSLGNLFANWNPVAKEINPQMFITSDTAKFDVSIYVIEHY